MMMILQPPAEARIFRAIRKSRFWFSLLLLPPHENSDPKVLLWIACGVTLSRDSIGIEQSPGGSTAMRCKMKAN